MNWRAHATKSFPSSLVQIQNFPKIFNGSTEYPISLQNYSIYISSMNYALVMEGIVELLSIFLNMKLKHYCYTYISIR